MRLITHLHRFFFYQNQRVCHITWYTLLPIKYVTWSLCSLRFCVASCMLCFSHSIHFRLTKIFERISLSHLTQFLKHIDFYHLYCTLCFAQMANGNLYHFQMLSFMPIDQRLQRNTHIYLVFQTEQPSFIIARYSYFNKHLPQVALSQISLISKIVKFH